MVAILVYFILPNGISTAKFLTPEEREFAMNRLKSRGDNRIRDQYVSEMNSIRGRYSVVLIFYCSEVEERFSWSEVGRGVFSWQTWLTACAYFGILSGLYSFGLFVSPLSASCSYV